MSKAVSRPKGQQTSKDFVIALHSLKNQTKILSIFALAALYLYDDLPISVCLCECLII